MPPTFGPVSFLVSAVDAAIGAGSSVGPVAFRWPKPLFVTGLILLPASGLRADMAALSLRIQDETFQDLITDGRYGHEASALNLSGLTPLAAPMFGDLVLARPYVLQRPVNTGDKWYITIDNASVGSVRPELTFLFEEGVERR